MRTINLSLVVAVTLFLVVRCGEDEPKESALSQHTEGSNLKQRAERGHSIFRNRDFGESGIACMDCHVDFPDSLQKKRIMPGHSILGAASRISTWYGEFTGEELTRTAYGAAKCAFIYQLRGDDLFSALSESDAEDLIAFYQYISTGNEPRSQSWEALSYPGDPQFKKDSIFAIVDSLNDINGDHERGETLFNKACSFCHSGAPDAVAPSPRMLRRYTSKVFLHVRAGKSNMPFFSYDRLSNQDVADIKEWIRRGAR